MRSFILFLLFLLLVANHQINSTGLQYTCVAIMVATAFVYVLFKGLTRRLQYTVDYIPILMVFLWFYGVFLGFSKGNDASFVVSNFAGMSLYVMYYIFLEVRLTKENLFKVIFLAAIVNVIYSVNAMLTYSYVYANVGDLNSYRVYYSIGLLVLSPFISVLLMLFVCGKDSVSSYPYSKHVKTNLFLLFLASISFVFLSVSKGFSLVFSFILLTVLLRLLVKLIARGELKFSEYMYVLVICMGVVSVIVSPLMEGLINNFSNVESSNAIRSEQAQFLEDEFSFFGAGLGAVLESGYTRSGAESAYGFELSYHSLIHKLGIFSILAMMAYAYTFLIALQQVVLRKDVFYPLLSFGAILFLIPSYGNPMLFSPIAVALHCMALFWLRLEKNKCIESTQCSKIKHY